MSQEGTALVPRAERVVNFYGDQITVAMVGEDDLYVPLRTLTEYLGLAWSPQLRRLERDEVLARKVRMLVIHGTDGRPREMTCLPLETIAGWLFGLTASKVKPELAPKIQQYREDCFKVLWRELQADMAQRHQQTPVVRTSLAQVREMALAIAHLAEQQMAMEGRIEYVEGTMEVVHRKLEHTDERLDRAAQVVGQLQQQLGALERKIEPGAHITDVQAAEISQRVKALAQLLTEKDPSKNHYQAIFGELYRRFRVSSYKLIPQNRYREVLAFLDDWLRTYDTPINDGQNTQ